MLKVNEPCKLCIWVIYGLFSDCYEWSRAMEPFSCRTIQPPKPVYLCQDCTKKAGPVSPAGQSNFQSVSRQAVLLSSCGIRSI